MVLEVGKAGCQKEEDPEDNCSFNGSDNLMREKIENV